MANTMGFKKRAGSQFQIRFPTDCLTMKIRTKITYSLLAVSLTAIVLVSALSFYFARDSVLRASGQHLLAVASGQKNFVAHVLQSWQDEIALITSRTQLRMSFAENLEDPDPEHVARMENILVDAIDASQSVEKIDMCDLQDRPVVSAGDPAHLSQSCERFVSENRNVIEVRNIWLNDAGKLYALIVGPVDLNGEIIGTVHTIVSAHEILAITQNYTGLGETSEVLIAERTRNGDARFLTPLRFSPNIGLTRIIKSDRTDIPMIRALIDKKEQLLAGESIDYRGQSVLAATAYISEMDWGMVVKIDHEEALQPIKSLFVSFTISAVIIFLLIMGIGLYVGRIVTAPILRFVRVLKNVKDGDFSERIEISSGDEVGYLAGSFNEMLDSLRTKTTELTESEMRQRAIVDSMVDGLATIDEKGHIESFNNACQTIFGYSAEEVIGQNVKMLMPEPYHSEHDGYLRNYLDTGAKKIIGIGREVEGQRKDGTTFPLDLSISRVDIAGRKIYSGILRDISQRKAAEEEIQQANAELEEFAYRTSHDLRSPLVSSLGLLGRAEKAIHADNNDKALLSLGFAQNSLSKLEALVKDILVLTQTKSIDEQEVDINFEDILNDALDKLRHMDNFERLDIQQNLKFPGTLVAKRSRVVLIVENLISNAIKYQDLDKKGAFIRISTYDSHNNFVLSIQDNGLGVPKNQQDNLFKMFKRFHPKTSFGSGLGLYMIKKSTTILGAEVYYEDPGDGSIFKLEIPITA